MQLDAVDHQTADAGDGEDGFDRDCAADQRAEVQAGDGDGRDDRVAQRVLIGGAEVAHALGAGSTDVVGAENFQHGGALGTRDAGEHVEALRDGGQNIALPGAVICGRENAPAQTAQQHEHGAYPECRSGNADHGENTDGVIAEAVVLDSGQNAHGNGQNQRDQHGQQAQLDGVGNGCEETLGNVAAGVPGGTKVAGEQVLDVVGKLNEERIGDAEGFTGFLNQFRRSIGAEHNGNRIAGGHVHNAIYQKDNGNHDGNHVSQSFYGILNQCLHPLE